MVTTKLASQHKSSFCGLLKASTYSWTSLPIMTWLESFFQAEDGIRDGTVTGVQTCALPISAAMSGIFKEIFFVSRVLGSASFGSTLEAPGRRRMSSNAKASSFSIIYFQPKKIKRHICKKQQKLYL